MFRMKIMVLCFILISCLGCPADPVDDSPTKPQDSGDPTQPIEILPESVEIQPLSSDVLLAASHQLLQVAITPSDTTNKTVQYTVEPDNVATVVGNTLIALEEGKATLRAVLHNGVSSELSFEVKGYAAPAKITLGGKEYKKVVDENFLSSDLRVEGNFHTIENGLFNLKPVLDKGEESSFYLSNDYLFDCIRIRLKLNEHNPNFRVRINDGDIIYLYEHDIAGDDYLKMKAELFKTEETGDGNRKGLGFYSDYTRSNADEFVNFDIVRQGNYIYIYINEKLAFNLGENTEWTSENLFKGSPQFLFGHWWGTSDNLRGPEGTQIEYVALYTSGEVIADVEPAIIPLPKELTRNSGIFYINSQTRIADKSGIAQDAIDLFTETIKNSSGINLIKEEAEVNSILLETDSSLENDEAYKLSVASNAITIKAKGYNGFVYGLQTVLQLLPPQVYSKTYQDNLHLQVPCCEITDSPRFEYRGFLLDCSRHFFEVETVKEILDELTKLKMNVFHWHLTDDGGFRFPFSGQFTAKSGNVYDFDAFMAKTAYRTGPNPEDSNFTGNWTFFNPNDPNDPNAQYKANMHGGYYTVEDIKEIIAYAKARGMKIIPEFDIPGHCKPLYYFFESLRCDQQNTDSNPGKEKEKKPNGFKDLCPTAPDIYEVMEYMLGQIDEVFDSEILHVGADEVAINNNSWYDVGPWWFCQRCEDKVREIRNNQSAQVNYDNLQYLQSDFLTKIQEIVYKKNNAMMIWNEGMKGGFQPGEKTYMSYWNPSGGSAQLNAAKSKRMKIINYDTYRYYLDFYQTQEDWDTDNPRANDWGNSAPIVTLEVIYEHDPTEALHAGSIGDTQWGIQGNMWNEHTSGYTKNGKSFTRKEKLYYMIFPRIVAVAERAWSTQSPNYTQFKERMQTQFRRLDAAGIENYCDAERN